jgi:hypothetical protein
LSFQTISQAISLFSGHFSGHFLFLGHFSGHFLGHFQFLGHFSGLFSFVNSIILALIPKCSNAEGLIQIDFLFGARRNERLDLSRYRMLHNKDVVHETQASGFVDDLFFRCDVNYFAMNFLPF